MQNLKDNRFAEQATGLNGVIDKAAYTENIFMVWWCSMRILMRAALFIRPLTEFAERARSALFEASKFDVQYWLAEEHQGL